MPQALFKKDLSDQYQKITDDFQVYYEKNIPSHLKYLKSLYVNQSFSNLSWITTILAFNDKKLFVPQTKTTGEFLTLGFIKY